MPNPLRQRARTLAPLLLVGLAGLGGGLSGAAGAAHPPADGPPIVARVDSHLWLARLDTPEGFDAASRTVLLLYAQTLGAARDTSDAAWKSRLAQRTLSRPSLDAWLDRETRQLQKNWRAATAHCPAVSDNTCVPVPAGSSPTATLASLEALSVRWQATLPASLQPWQGGVRLFLRQYVDEQARLAALFPRISSEIGLFAPGREFTGDNLPDRQFFLTFDDGPTPVGGRTDALQARLKTAGLSGTFFVLGQLWAARAARDPTLMARYAAAGQCVGSHGWQHLSHAHWPAWQSSVTRSRALLLGSGPGTDEALLPLFRPPYGQRRADSAGFFAAQGLRVVLWNMDSEDWNTGVSAADAENRMTVLMLLRRHGILLFHDIHPKAIEAVPGLQARFGSAVTWQPCQALAKVP